MTKRSGKYSAVNCQLPLWDVIVGFLCYILWGLLYLVIRKCLCIKCKLLCRFWLKYEKKKYSKN